MIDVGSELSHARERLVLSLTELASRTKISEATLLAIERNDLKALPGGIYTRGFLRAYAREVGCDPEEIVARYRTQFAEEGESSRLHGPSTPSLTVRCESGQVHSASVDAMDRRDARAKLIGTVMVLLVGGLLYFLLDRSMHTTKPSPDLITVDAPQSRPAVETATLVAVGTDGPSAGTASVDEQLNALRLDIQARALCWLSGTADGRRVLYRLLNAGERIQIEAKILVLRIGDAANLSSPSTESPAVHWVLSTRSRFISTRKLSGVSSATSSFRPSCARPRRRRPEFRALKSARRQSPTWMLGSVRTPRATPAYSGDHRFAPRLAITPASNAVETCSSPLEALFTRSRSDLPKLQALPWTALLLRKTHEAKTPGDSEAWGMVKRRM